MEERAKERQLATATVKGDQKALLTLYQLYGTPLLNLFNRVVGDEDDAMDLLQALFLSLPQKLRSFRGSSSLKTWLHRAAMNSALDQLRSRQRRRSLMERFLTPQQQPALQQEEPLEQREIRDLTDRLLQSFDPQTRAILWLKEGEGYDLQSIAEICSLPLGTVKSRLSRARAKGLHWLEDEGYGSIDEITA